MPDAATQSGVLRIALDVPLRRLFDYRPPPGGPASIRPGVRVRVPFGRQRQVGVVIETATQSQIPPERLRAALELIDETPVLDDSALALLIWAADYYHHPIGEAVAAALPKSLRVGAPSLAREIRWLATPDGLTAYARGEPARAPRQRELLERLVRDSAAAAGTTAGILDGLMPGWREPARALVRRGWVAAHEDPAARRAACDAAARELSSTAEGPPLNAEQSVAVEAILGSLDRYTAWALQGVTGSGKTEVYLRAIAAVLARGRRALVLVPEIGLTPQLVARFRARFGAPLAVLHSALTDRERLEAWRSAFSGQAPIVLGTRSAVFAPVPELGIIVVDEEHDASFKQHDGGFRYSARDLAVVRAQHAGVPIVLGSATPALETLHNVSAERYRRLVLPNRAVQCAPPRLVLVDLRAHAVHAGLSTPVLNAIGRHLAENGQVLVFINRRGFAPTLLCTACGWIAPCRDCDARLTVHREARLLRCHHCGAEAPLPEKCPQCGFLTKPVGQGTERVAETLRERWADTPLVRLDRDVVRHRGDLEAIVAQLASGSARILVGTQMVTKGHDFPDMTLVVVLNADQGLFSTDFRAPERLAQTIVQVAGRAGRANRPGEVLIQTEYPDHPLLKNLLAEGYEGFARSALAERAQAAWPPFSRLAALRDSARTQAAALEFLKDARRAARARSSVRLLGPVPAAMAKRAGRYHAQLLIESAERAPLHQFLRRWLPEIEQLPSARRVRWALDVDPIELY